MMSSISPHQLQKAHKYMKKFPCEVGLDYCPHLHNEDMRYRGIKQHS